MRELALLFRLRARQMLRRLCGAEGGVRGLVREHSLLKIAVVAVGAVALWWGLFLLFLDGFEFLGRMPDIRAMIAGILLALFFGALTVMLTLSNGIIAYGSLFRSEETTFLLGRPLRPEALFMYKLADGLLFSSWAFFFLGMPLIFAYGWSAGAPAGFYPMVVLFFAAFVAIPACVGAAGALAMGRWFSHRPGRVAALVAVCGLALVGTWLLRALPAFRLGASGYEVWMRNVLERLAWSENPLLPSYWVAQGMLLAGRGDAGGAFFYLLVTLSNSLMLLWATWALARRTYLRAYHCFHGLARRRRFARGGLVRRLVRGGTFWLAGPVRAMIEKDVLNFLRDPVQWSQALVFFGLIGVYVLNLRSLNYHVQGAAFKNMVAFLNLAATSLTLATFANRFVFPLLSLERRRMWVLGLAPIERGDILLGKFVFAFGGCLLISGGLMTLSDVLLDVGADMLALHLFAALVVSAGVSGLSTGLGAVYTQPNEDNPSRIVSGFGGTLNLVLGLVLVGLVIALLAVPCHLYLVRGGIGERTFRTWIALSMAGCAAIGCIACAAPLAWGRRALERMEA